VAFPFEISDGVAPAARSMLGFDHAQPLTQASKGPGASGEPTAGAAVNFAYYNVCRNHSTIKQRSL